MPLQSWIHHWEEGAGARMLKVVVAFLAFVAVAALYDLFTVQPFSSCDAMESAQLARNISDGKGYTTDSIRPLALYLLGRAADTGQSSKVLAQRVPDLSIPPVYPLVLAGLMKVAPFHFAASQTWTYQPERWITAFNQALFFSATVLLFFLARRLFDTRVAWLSSILFAGTNLFWKFSVSGLSTLWVILIFLAIVWLLVEIDARSRSAEGVEAKSAVGPALLAGALLGLGGLSLYAFGWMVLPVILFVLLSAPRSKGKLCIAVLAAFMVVMSPWVARNFRLSGTPFGTATYSALQDTPPFPDDTLERSTNPQAGFKRISPFDLMNKLVDNMSAISRDQLPNLGGNWILAFFVAGLLLPFRNPILRRLRFFLVGSLILLAVVQALGQTHLSAESPQINSENLLVLLTPLIFIFGASFFFVLWDQVALPGFQAHGLGVAGLVVILCSPLLVSVLVTRAPPANSPYAPLHLQRTALLMKENELMMSDIPWAMAWYGDRSCAWLSLDDDEEFFKVNAFKPIHVLFLTQRTTDQRYLSQIKAEAKGWGHFVLESAEHGEVPSGFPLRKAPFGFLPDQFLLSDKVRWRAGS
jgi:4-amino-4-deoxy-L-arabinose transferase-like glycosyltransferase